MARATQLNQLTVREMQTAADGFHPDGGGLYLLIRGASSSWVLRYTGPTGRRREMGLGPAVRDSARLAGDSLRLARDLAQDARELLRRGVDPIDHRDHARGQVREAEAARKEDAARASRTLAWCARDFHQRVIERTRTDKHAAQYIASLENHIPESLWKAPVDTITAPALLSALTSIKPHARARNLTDDHQLAETVRRLRQRLEVIFEDAQFHGWCSSNPALAIRRKLREAHPAQQAGNFAALPYKEVAAFMARLRAAEGTAARCLELAILAAARTNEVLAATWDEFDFQARTWTLGAKRMKAGVEHVVYLSDAALAVLAAQKGQHLQWVFPSAMKADSPLSNMAMLAVLGRLGVRDRTTVHGLCRASFSTWAYDTGAARPDVIEACLAHREADKVKASYNRAQFADERRALLAAWAAYVAQPAAKVIPLGQAA